MKAIEESYFKEVRNGKEQITLHLLDTSGVDQIEHLFIQKVRIFLFLFLIKFFVLQWFDWADAFVFVYSITSQASFEVIKSLGRELIRRKRSLFALFGTHGLKNKHY